MTQTVLVVGHRNPDNDSICSAVAYAQLQNELAWRSAGAAAGELAGAPDAANAPGAAAGEPALRYVPARLGPLPPESKWVLEQAGMEPPVALSHVFARVADAMTPEPISIASTASILEAGRRLRHHNVRSLVVKDEQGFYRGLVTTRMIAERYISATDLLEEPGATQQMVAADLMASLGQSVESITETQVLELEAEGLLTPAIDDLMASSLREAVVLDEERRCVGILTRSDITPRPRRKVILVDHNESRQAAPGIEEAEVVGIVDHHRLGDITTAAPVLFLNMPLGSTATIISLEYARNGVAISPAMAQVLLAALLTDTVILKSPTATETDRNQAALLAEIAGVDVMEFGLALFRQRNGEATATVAELTGRDAKEFAFGDAVCLIAQYETVDLAAVMQREDEIRAHLRALVAECGYEFALFMVTDIIAEGSQFICEGNRRIVNRVFGISCTGQGGTWMPGILSRKKQVAARILGA